MPKRILPYSLLLRKSDLAEMGNNIWFIGTGIFTSLCIGYTVSLAILSAIGAVARHNFRDLRVSPLSVTISLLISPVVASSVDSVLLWVFATCPTKLPLISVPSDILFLEATFFPLFIPILVFASGMLMTLGISTATGKFISGCYYLYIIPAAILSQTAWLLIFLISI